MVLLFNLKYVSDVNYEGQVRQKNYLSAFRTTPNNINDHQSFPLFFEYVKCIFFRFVVRA